MTDYEIKFLENRRHKHPSGFAGKDSCTLYYFLSFKDRKEAGSYLEEFLKEEDKITDAALRFFISKQPYAEAYPNIPYRFVVKYIDYCTYIICVNDGPSMSGY